MVGEQYGLILATAISAGLIITVYPALLEGLIFIALVVWILFYKLIKWAESKNVDGYINSLVASICAIFGIIYLTKDGLIWFIFGYAYLIFSIYTMKIAIEETVTHG